MGYTIDYSSMSKKEKMEKALVDCYNYLPPKAASTLYDAAMQSEKYRQFSFICNFAGVSGPPTVAFWEDVRQTCQDMMS